MGPHVVRSATMETLVPADRLPLGRNGQSLLRSEALVGGNCSIGEKERSPFAVPDHGLDGIEKVARSPIGFPSSPIASR